MPLRPNCHAENITQNKRCTFLIQHDYPDFIVCCGFYWLSPFCLFFLAEQSLYLDAFLWYKAVLKISGLSWDAIFIKSMFQMMFPNSPENKLFIFQSASIIPQCRKAVSSLFFIVTEILSGQYNTADVLFMQYISNAIFSVGFLWNANQLPSRLYFRTLDCNLDGKGPYFELRQTLKLSTDFHLPL